VHKLTIKNVLLGQKLLTKENKHWLLEDALHFIISTYHVFHKKLISMVPNSLVNLKASIFLSRIWKFCVIHEIISVGSHEPFPFFLHTFEKRKGHNMLTLMLDPKFKSMCIVTTHVVCDNVFSFCLLHLVSSFCLLHVCLFVFRFYSWYVFLFVFS
jgi:hypothetical protein